MQGGKKQMINNLSFTEHSQTSNFAIQKLFVKRMDH